MEYITDVITPARLTGFVQTAVAGGMPFAGIAGANEQVESRPGVASAGLPNLFPVTETDDIKYEIENTNLGSSGEVARYRTWDAVPDIGKRPAIAIIGGEILPLDRSYKLNEEELKRFSRLRAGIGERSDARVADTILNDAVRAAQAVQNRLTLAHAEILKTGIVTLTELGQPVTGNALTVAHAVPANQINVTASPAWSNHGSSKPVDDLQAYEAAYMDNNNGEPPDEWWISSTVAADLMANTDLLARLVFAIGTSNAAQLPDIGLVNQIASRADVFAPLRVVNIRRPPLAGGAVTSLLSSRLLIGVKAGMGKTMFSTPACVGLMPGNGTIQASQAAGIIAYAQSDIRPAQVITTAEALALPVLTDPAKLFVATV